MFVSPNDVDNLQDLKCAGVIVRYLSPHLHEDSSTEYKESIVKAAEAKYGKQIQIVPVGGGFCQDIYAIFISKNN